MMSQEDAETNASGISAECSPQAAAVTLADLRSTDADAAGATDSLADERLRDDAARAGYELLEELGRGGMGVVFKATQRELQRTVAIKMLREGEYSSPAERQRFRKEAQAVARLRHPNIVQIYEVGEFGGRPYLCLEFVAGGSLSRKLAGTPLPARAAAELVETLARAVHFSHERGIVHRDLKPANVLLEEVESGGLRLDSSCERPNRSSGPQAPARRDSEQPSTLSTQLIPKITDFGLAKRMDGQATQTNAGEFLGTPSYMAPEQVAAHGKRIDRTVDVYALGAMLYELLTGRPPFKAATPLETYCRVLTEEPVPPGRLLSRLPRDLETICLRCLEKDSRRRYATALALADDLRRFLSDRPIVARPASPAERALKWCRRRPAVAGLIAVCCAAVLILLGTMLHSNARLHAERDAARKAQEDADAQRARAEQALHHALKTVDDFFTRVSENELLRVNGMEPLRRELLQTALDYYNDFIERWGDHPVLREELGSAYHRVGMVNQAIGSRADALVAYERARDIF